MKRRAFLGGMVSLPIGAAAIAGITSAPLARASVTAGEDAALLADHLLHAYPARSSLTTIGEAYWREAAVDGCNGCLPGELDAFLHHLELPVSTLGRMKAADIRDHIAARTAADFGGGRIVPVQGWLLGETEARLCAIAALHQA